MSVVWHRLSFEPKQPQNAFKTSKEFEAWCREAFVDFDFVNAGYMIQPAHYAVGRAGAPFWNIIIHGESTIVEFLSAHHWSVGEHYVHLYVKHSGENEALYRGDMHVAV